ncbi:hypothetical protein ES702_01084 [subsurface metagenome]
MLILQSLCQQENFIELVQSSREVLLRTPRLMSPLEFPGLEYHWREKAHGSNTYPETPLSRLFFDPQYVLAISFELGR